MDRNNILNIKKKVENSLCNGQIKKAFDLLKVLSEHTLRWQAKDTLSEMEMTYRYMLDYEFRGMEDPTREEVYARVVRTLYELTDEFVEEELLSTSAQDVYLERKKIQQSKSVSPLSEYQHQLEEIANRYRIVSLQTHDTQRLSDLRAIAVQRERLLSSMFLNVFVTGKLSENQKEEWISFVDNDKVEVSERSLFLSAVMLGLIKHFDESKLEVLLHACLSSKEELQVRAMVAAVFVLMKYDARLSYYSLWRVQLDAVMEEKSCHELFISILIQLIRSTQTEKISKKMLSEIIPEIMKFSAKTGTKLTLEDLMNDDELAAKNPDWKKDLESSGLASKLEEYTELHLEGADVFHSTFSKLKNFPFFNELSNWFLPFDTNYSELLEMTLDKSNPLLTAVSKSGYMCDSDKYSFCLSIAGMPRHYQNTMALQLDEQSAELSKQSAALNHALSRDVLSNQYLQNLYRFFKLHPQHEDFEDVFSLGKNFYQYQTISPYLQRVEIMQQLADYSFSKNRFQDAEAIYLLLTHKGGEPISEWWQKIGYARQMTNNLLGAIQAYSTADTIDADNIWVLKRLGQCHRLMKQPEKALEYFRRAEQLSPNHAVGLLINIGHCLLDLEQYEEALNCYFKVEFEGNAPEKVQRPIAWTALLCGKYDLAKNYYEHLITEGNSSEHDYLNMGHIYLATNNPESALKSYLKVLQQKGVNSFIELFNQDHEILLKMGVSSALVSRVIDQVQYTLSKP